MPISRDLPSKRWTSFDDWDFDGMKERLEAALKKIDKSALLRHAQSIMGQKVTMSQPFSAGQYWICFEIVVDDGRLIIARVRLPRHPDAPIGFGEDDEAYATACEVATMKFVREKLPAIPVPRIYAHEGSGSRLAAEAGAAYMLMEGFYGNTLQDVEFDICKLPVAKQEHIMAQWTRIQAEVATISHPQIGSICSISESGEPVIGRLATASIEGLKDAGPFSKSIDYFTAVANAAIDKLPPSARPGALIFCDILQKTTLFQDIDVNRRFSLNHMDFGTQNILVDNDFNFIAVIDWEFAQTAPWQINHYPMPFPLAALDVDATLKDPSSLAYDNVSRQEVSRRIYRQKFQEIEEKLSKEGRPLEASFADVLGSPASRIYSCFTTLGDVPQADADLAHGMAQLAFKLDKDELEKYVQGMSGIRGKS